MQRIRWPRNYSPWAANSDSDSDASLTTSPSTPAATKRCPSLGRPTTGVYLFCMGDQFQPSLSPPSSPGSSAFKPLVSNTMALATVPQTDAIFATKPLALSQLLGVPLLTRRLSAKPALELPRNAHFDNIAATALHVDPATGYAPAEWCQGVGTLLVVREDQQPLTKDLLENIVKFSQSLAQLFGGRADDLRAYATPRRFADFCAGSDEHSYQTPLTWITPGSELAASQRISQGQTLNESWFDVSKSQVSV